MREERRTLAALDLGQAPTADALMLYQITQEARACQGTIQFEYPHLDEPIQFRFDFQARRPIYWQGRRVDQDEDGAVHLSLTYSVKRGGPTVCPTCGAAL